MGTGIAKVGKNAVFSFSVNVRPSCPFPFSMHCKDVLVGHRVEFGAFDAIRNFDGTTVQLFAARAW